MTTAMVDSMTGYVVLQIKVNRLKEALDRFAGLLPEGRSAGFYNSLFATLERHDREFGGLVEIVGG